MSYTRNNRQADIVVDAVDMVCPLPVLKAQKALRSMVPGGLLLVKATDPGAAADFEAFCQAQGHILHHQEEKDSILSFWIEKGASC